MGYNKLIVLVLLLSGCASSQYDRDKLINENKEQIFVETNNQGKLIEFYKNELKQKENAETRRKLAGAYLDADDAEAAIFVLKQLPSSELDFESELLLAKAYFQFNKLDLSSLHISKSLELNSQSGEAHNLAGILSSVEGEFELAESHFIESRKRFYQEDVVKNNLAALYILQQRYQESYDLLISVYNNNPEDAKAKANLTIALVKLGQYPQARALLEHDYSDEQINDIVTAMEQSALDGLEHRP
ncbi:secretion protein [Vibrio aquaticus]|uniref:Secretion protein n=1 Tax=Vibrio aquaticus TaxID=2496559 RepID=A0A3S0N517_9VIBR|nr:tetratricopeptide repeat protein [Vibrio aquaticus]RTZ15588.1 secretion protein [Vibrio aquaticus]